MTDLASLASRERLPQIKAPRRSFDERPYGLVSPLHCGSNVPDLAAAFNKVRVHQCPTRRRISEFAGFGSASITLVVYRTAAVFSLIKSADPLPAAASSASIRPQFSRALSNSCQRRAPRKLIEFRTGNRFTPYFFYCRLVVLYILAFVHYGCMKRII